MTESWEPIFVNTARVWRTYLGGRELDRAQGRANPEDGHYPEEWMFSVTHAVNPGAHDPNEGLCTLRDEPQRTLKACVEAAPEPMLGAAHVRAWGAQPGVLLKKIDSAERLTIQVHPDKAAAARLFGSAFGKTECWHILGTRADAAQPPCVYMGFRPGIRREAWERAFALQDIPGMLGMLHRFAVRPGETYLVRGGVPHAIGAGCLLMEIQEPTDYTIRVERTTPSGLAVEDRLCHQGLGFDKMFDCFAYEGKTEKQARAAWQLPVREADGAQWLVRYTDTPCFAMCRLSLAQPRSFGPRGTFCQLAVTQGSGALVCAGKTRPVRPGDQIFVPAATEPFTLAPTPGQSLALLQCFGPRIG